MLDGSAIAAILTGILAFCGVLATAWSSGWNESRVQRHKARKALAQYSVPLLSAAWDLANWFYEILDEDNYSPIRCKAYGDGWSSEFTSYTLGQYFAAVHIIREMTTHFYGHTKDKRAIMLKKLLYKIEDEFESMHHEGRESREMRWFQGDIKAAQELLTVAADVDHDGTVSELKGVGWIEFHQRFAEDSEVKDRGSVLLRKSLRWYEEEFQRIVFRRFMHLYSTVPGWVAQDNPQGVEKLQARFSGKPKKVERITNEYEQIKEEQEIDPNAGIIVPDHRVRRLQHLLCDLVGLLGQVSTMDFNRPIRRCEMRNERNVVAPGNPLDLVTGPRIPCDCYDIECNPDQEDFWHRHFNLSKEQEGFERRHILRTESSFAQKGRVGVGNLRSRESDLVMKREKVDASHC